MTTCGVLLKGHQDIAASTLAYRFAKPPGFVDAAQIKGLVGDADVRSEQFYGYP